MSIWRDLDEHEVVEFEQWAIDNYNVGDIINPTWHPVVQRKCQDINSQNGRGCILCGTNLKKDHFSRDSKSLCFDCDFWMEKITLSSAEKEMRAIIDNNHYMIGGTDSYVKGFNGKEFIIIFNDGRKVMTNNLWHQGKIPERFRAMLPNNARFMRRKENESCN